jgi:hypothetical protein
LQAERTEPTLRGATVSDVKNTELSLRGFYASWQRHLQDDAWLDRNGASQ